MKSATSIQLILIIIFCFEKKINILIKKKSLGAQHDQAGNTCVALDGFIMTPIYSVGHYNPNAYLLSHCSIEYFKQTLLSNNG